MPHTQRLNAARLRLAMSAMHRQGLPSAAQGGEGANAAASPPRQPSSRTTGSMGRHTAIRARLHCIAIALRWACCQAAAGRQVLPAGEVGSACPTSTTSSTLLNDPRPRPAFVHDSPPPRPPRAHLHERVEVGAHEAGGALGHARKVKVALQPQPPGQDLGEACSVVGGGEGGAFVCRGVQVQGCGMRDTQQNAGKVGCGCPRCHWRGGGAPRPACPAALLPACAEGRSCGHAPPLPSPPDLSTRSVHLQCTYGACLWCGPARHWPPPSSPGPPAGW